MRLVTACLAFVVLGSWDPPSSFELHSRFGQATEERFAASANINVSVSYGTDHRACQVTISPASATPGWTGPMIDTAHLMDPDEAESVLQQIAPTEVRGKLALSGSFQTGAPTHNFELFEHLTITRNYIACSGCSYQNRPWSYVIAYSRSECPAPPIKLDAK